MLFKRILVPLDGSELAEKALEPAFELAQQSGGEVILLCVAVAAEELMVGVTAMTMRPYELQRGSLHYAQEKAEAYLRGIKSRWLNARVPIYTEVISGTPPELIVAVAKEQEVDLIVMSTHGRTGVSRLVYGSVAEAVLRGARLPVLLIPVRA